MDGVRGRLLRTHCGDKNIPEAWAIACFFHFTDCLNRIPYLGRLFELAIYGTILPVVLVIA